MDGRELAMTDTIEARRHGRAMHALPLAAKSHFRRAVFEARSGREKAISAFAAVGVTDVVLHTLDLFDLVASGIAALEEEDRAAAEVALLGQAIQSGPAALIREVLTRGRSDGLDDTQLAGGILVVLESHGLLRSDGPATGAPAFWETPRLVPHAEAREAARRLINSHFRNPDQARVSIPANPDRDDDLVLTSYIAQRERAEACP